jgi:serine/threonine protein kinase
MQGEVSIVRLIHYILYSHTMHHTPGSLFDVNAHHANAAEERRRRVQAMRKEWGDDWHRKTGGLEDSLALSNNSLRVNRSHPLPSLPSTTTATTTATATAATTTDGADGEGGEGGSAFSAAQRSHFVLDCVRGLHRLHSNSPTPVLHCDLKSLNLLLSDDWVMKLAGMHHHTLPDHPLHAHTLHTTDFGESAYATDLANHRPAGTHTTVLILLYSYYCTHTTALLLLYSPTTGRQCRSTGAPRR